MKSIEIKNTDIIRSTYIHCPDCGRKHFSRIGLVMETIGEAIFAHGTTYLVNLKTFGTCYHSIRKGPNFIAYCCLKCKRRFSSGMTKDLEAKLKRLALVRKLKNS